MMPKSSEIEGLTSAQIVILERLNAGENLTFSSGRDARYWFLGDRGRAPHPGSIKALHRAGLVEQVKSGAPLTVGIYDIILTDAGRAALSASPRP